MWLGGVGVRLSRDWVEVIPNEPLCVRDFPGEALNVYTWSYELGDRVSLKQSNFPVPVGQHGPGGIFDRVIMAGLIILIIHIL